MPMEKRFGTPSAALCSSPFEMRQNATVAFTTRLPDPLLTLKEAQAMIPPIVVHCGIGLTTTLISIPLVLRMAPMNRYYGIRVPKAFTSEENWYDINAYGGKLLLAYGLLLTIFGITGQDWAPSETSIWMAPFIVGPLLLFFPILALISAYAKGLPD